MHFATSEAQCMVLLFGQIKDIRVKRRFGGIVWRQTLACCWEGVRADFSRPSGNTLDFPEKIPGHFPGTSLEVWSMLRARARVGVCVCVCVCVCLCVCVCARWGGISAQSSAPGAPRLEQAPTSCTAIHAPRARDLEKMSDRSLSGPTKRPWRANKPKGAKQESNASENDPFSLIDGSC